MEMKPCLGIYSCNYPGHLFAWRIQRPLRGYGYGFGHGGVGLIGAILIIIVILMLLGRI